MPFPSRISALCSTKRNCPKRPSRYPPRKRARCAPPGRGSKRYSPDEIADKFVALQEALPPEVMDKVNQRLKQNSQPQLLRNPSSGIYI